MVQPEGATEFYSVAQHGKSDKSDLNNRFEPICGCLDAEFIRRRCCGQLNGGYIVCQDREARASLSFCFLSWVLYLRLGRMLIDFAVLALPGGSRQQRRTHHASIRWNFSMPFWYFVTIPELPNQGSHQSNTVDLIKYMVIEGSWVTPGTPFALVENRWAAFEIQVTGEGYVSKTFFGPGTTIRIGDPIAIINCDGEKIPYNGPTASIRISEIKP